MPRIVVDVTLKPEISDPQGQAVETALASLGFADVRGVRIGKHVEIELAGAVDDARLAQVRDMADRLLANPVIEDFAVRVDGSVA